MNGAKRGQQIQNEQRSLICTCAGHSHAADKDADQIEGTDPERSGPAQAVSTQGAGVFFQQTNIVPQKSPGRGPLTPHSH